MRAFLLAAAAHILPDGGRPESFKLSSLVLALALTAGAAGCVGSNDEAPVDNSTDTNDTTTMPPVAQAAAVSLFDRSPGVGVPPTTMGIDPATLELTLGMPVNLTVTNDGDSAHDLVIEGLGVKTESIAPGESASVEFTPMEAGTYRMYCSVGGDGPIGHAAQGMRGEVVVS